nr:zinc finger protein 260-like [Nerophis lumbriciformis]XP_061836083.1 zinc finger protein 260-like [Nerophis lumbriciformis]
MDDYCYAKMATSCKREHERESSSKSPTDIKTKTADKDVQQLVGHPEEPPPKSGGSSTLKQNPQPPHIKEEEEELECLLGTQEDDLTKLPLTVVFVKTEDGEEKPQPDNLKAPLSDRKAEDKVEDPWSSDTDCEDIKQLIGHPEAPPLQPQGGRCTLKQEDLQPPHFKEEEEELGVTQEGDCLLGPKETDITKIPQTVVTVKTEDDEEKPQPHNGVEVTLSSDTDYEDVQQLIGHPEGIPLQPQSGSSPLKQEDPRSTHIKEEEGELCITQEGECLLGPDEADLTKLPLTVVSVKTEDDVEKPQVDNLLSPPSDSEAEDEVEVTLSSDTDCEGDVRTHTDNKHAQSSKKVRGQTRFSCSVCAKSFSRRSNFTQHMRTHKGEKPFSCSICGKRFSQKSHLPEHMTTHTGEKIFHCSVCGKRFSNKRGLTEHIKTHTGEKPFKCLVCNKSFSQRSNLTQHNRTHTGEKPFNCFDCGKSFSQKSNLTKHMKVHTGEKPFNCFDCGKSFSQKSNLTEHMKVHTGVKPFNCSVCDKTFLLKRHMIEHMTTHTRVKPFNCSVCGKSFSQKSNLTKHIRTHAG